MNVKLQGSDLLKTDRDLYWKMWQLVHTMLGINGRIACYYITLCVFLHLKNGVEYPELFNEAAKAAGKHKQTIISSIRNAIKNAKKNSVPVLLSEVVKEKDESTPIDFVIDIIDFIQDFDFMSEEDEEGVYHAYYQSKIDGHKIPTLN